jgi:hypothetical protein
MMELHEIIENNYNLDTIIKIEKTKNGSGSTFLVETKNEKYIAKTNERIDFVQIYEKVQNKLNQLNLLQSRIIKTNKSVVMTSEGIVLYEFIEGDNFTTLSKIQCENAIKYIKEYNKALSFVPFNNEELIIKNHWDKAKSIEFIVNEFPNFLKEIELEIQDKKNIYEAINILSKNKGRLSRQKKQLIHSDLGADNFIFRNDKIASIIDFTPEYNHKIYSLCQFIYWNYLWYAPNINMDEINNYFGVYNFDSDIDIEEDIFHILLLNSALYRIVGPIIDMFSRNIKDYSGLKKRFSIINELLKKL